MIDNRPILLARNGETDLHRGRRTYNETDGLIVRRIFSEADVAYVVVVNNKTVGLLGFVMRRSRRSR